MRRCSGCAMSKVIIHNSGVTDFQKCRRAWWFSDRNLGLGFAPKIPIDPFLLGRWIHIAMWRYYNAGATDVVQEFSDAVTTTLTEWALDSRIEMTEYLADRVGRLLRLGTGMLRGYGAWSTGLTGVWADENLESVGLEEEGFSLDMPNYIYAGTWDRVVRRKDNRTLWLVEHKTDGNKEPEKIIDGVDKDWQPRFYVWAAEQLLGEPVAGVIYNVIRKVDPFNVELLQNGLPTRNKVKLLNQTTPEVYTDLVMGTIGANPELNREWESYQKTISWLTMQPQQHYLRFPLYVSDAWKQRVPGTLAWIANEMWKTGEIGATQPDIIVPTLNRYACNFCAFKQPCGVMDDGGDWAFAIDERMERKFPERL